jgi:hypothetical protein
MITVMGVLLGIDMQGFAREEGSDELPPGMARQPPTPPASPPQASTSSNSASANSNAKSNTGTGVKKPAEPADVTMAEPEDEEDEEAKAKKEAEREKQLGSEAYKKRDFETAARSFQRAWEIWPKDITFLTNLSGARKCHGIATGVLMCRQLCIWNRGSMTSLSRLRKRPSRRVDL